jgi:hypothetical protein
VATDAIGPKALMRVIPARNQRPWSEIFTPVRWYEKLLCRHRRLAQRGSPVVARTPRQRPGIVVAEEQRFGGHTKFGAGGPHRDALAYGDRNADGDGNAKEDKIMAKSANASARLLLIFLSLMFCLTPGRAFAVNIPFQSDGSLGAFSPSANVVFDTDTGTYSIGSTVFSGGVLDYMGGNLTQTNFTPSPVRVYDFSSFYVPSGVTFHAYGQIPLVLTATENITIAGTVDVSGGNGASNVSGGGGGGGGGGALGLFTNSSEILVTTTGKIRSNGGAGALGGSDAMPGTPAAQGGQSGAGGSPGGNGGSISGAGNGGVGSGGFAAAGGGGGGGGGGTDVSLGGTPGKGGAGGRGIGIFSSDGERGCDAGGNLMAGTCIDTAETRNRAATVAAAAVVAVWEAARSVARVATGQVETAIRPGRAADYRGVQRVVVEVPTAKMLVALPARAPMAA